VPKRSEARRCQGFNIAFVWPREGVGGSGFEMAVECRIFAHNMDAGSWMERKLVKRWVFPP